MPAEFHDALPLDWVARGGRWPDQRGRGEGLGIAAEAVRWQGAEDGAGVGQVARIKLRTSGNEFPSPALLPAGAGPTVPILILGFYC